VGIQRQPIGIARALCKHGPLLVFVEGTSALDTVMEEAVMEEVEGLRKDLTILLIAHRLSRVQRCNRLIRLVNLNKSIKQPPDNLKIQVLRPLRYMLILQL
jgi:ABC-type multidrug transport system fused ATPase/permease subunit